VNEPPLLDPSASLVYGTGICVVSGGSPSDVIHIIATATDPNGIAQVTG